MPENKSLQRHFFVANHRAGCRILSRLTHKQHGLNKMNSPKSYNPKTMCFPPREVSDAALKNYWLQTVAESPSRFVGWPCPAPDAGRAMTLCSNPNEMKKHTA